MDASEHQHDDLIEPLTSWWETVHARPIPEQASEYGRLIAEHPEWQREVVDEQLIEIAGRDSVFAQRLSV